MLELLHMENTSMYKTRLEDEKQKLESELESVGRRNPSNPEDWEAVPEQSGKEADVLDQASNLDSYQENAAILKELEIRHSAVLSALARIEDGTYGTCGVGGEAIEPERLNADPAATTCVAHMSA